MLSKLHLIRKLYFRLLTDSGDEYHPCHLCGKTYKTSGSLKNHRSLYHRNQTIKYQSYRGQPTAGSWQGQSQKGLSSSRPPQALVSDDPQPLQYNPWILSRAPVSKVLSNIHQYFRSFREGGGGRMSSRLHPEVRFNALGVVNLTF